MFCKKDGNQHKKDGYITFSKIKDGWKIKDGNSPCRLECEKFRDHDPSW